MKLHYCSIHAICIPLWVLEFSSKMGLGKNLVVKFFV